MNCFVDIEENEDDDDENDAAESKGG